LAMGIEIGFVSIIEWHVMARGCRWVGVGHAGVVEVWGSAGEVALSST
jgi:hypothetical protein